MDKSVSDLLMFYDAIFKDSYLENVNIDIIEEEGTIVLAANRNGMMYLAGRLIELCKDNKEWSHYHLDEAGAVRKCDKPMVISLIKED